MSMNETVLEMHFHKPLMDLFRSTFGLGNSGSINFYKYSPQREVFIGFDQAYAKTELTEYEFFNLLKQAAESGKYHLPDKFVGYFLQFKVVTQLTHRMKRTPTAITARPYYRASLSTTKDVNTGHSQHELLHQLTQNPGAMVYYACPMIFERSMLYEVNVNLDTLQLPDLRTCPSSYSDNDHHHIYFNTTTTDPIWCSEPVVGKSETPGTLVKKIKEALNAEAPHLAASLLDQLTNIQRLGLTGQEEIFRESQSPPSTLKLIGDALTVVRISHNQDE